MKYGLVLEGEGMRGIFSAGVIDVFMENGISFDGAVGVSAGAAFGCNIKSGQNGRAIRYNLRFANNKHYCSGWSFLKTGDLFGGKFCYHILPEKLDVFDTKTFNESEMEFYVVCTDVVTGRPVYHKIEKINYTEYEWIRASASMPLAAKIVDINGRKLLDGGISDSIPLSFMEKKGYGKNVVILTQPRNYVKEKSGSLPLIKLKYMKYSGLVNAASQCHVMYNNELKYIRKAESEEKTFVIAPDIRLPIGRIEHNTDTIQTVYRIGRRIANENLERVKDFLKK